MSDFEVGRHWSTDLEPGTWYEIVKADQPRIIAGFVFVPLPLKDITIDYREVDGSRLSKRNTDHRRLVPQWQAAIQRYENARRSGDHT